MGCLKFKIKLYHFYIRNSRLVTHETGAWLIHKCRLYEVRQLRRNISLH